MVASFSSHKLWGSLLVSEHIMSLHILSHWNSNLPLLCPLDNTIWCAHSCPVSTFSCLPLQYFHRRLCGHREDSGDHICASCSKVSVPKTQLRKHLNWSEMQTVRQLVYILSQKNVIPIIFSAFGTLFSSVSLVKITKLSWSFPNCIWKPTEMSSDLKESSV